MMSLPEVRCISPSDSVLEFAPHPDDVRAECPTCRGLGYMTNDNDSAIALIALSDKRLKPKRTKLYVGLSVLTFLIVFSVLVFILLERTSQVHLTQVDAVKYELEDISNISITFKFYAEVKNYNYLAVTFSNLIIGIEGREPFGNCSVANAISVPGRSTKTYICQTTVNFAQEFSFHIQAVCRPAARYHQYTLMFSTSVSWQYLSFASGVLSDSTWDCFSCRANSTHPDRGTQQSCVK